MDRLSRACFASLWLRCATITIFHKHTIDLWWQVRLGLTKVQVNLHICNTSLINEVDVHSENSVMQQRQQRFRSIVSAVDTRTSLFVNHAVMIVNVTAVYFANVYSYNYFLIKILSSDILETSSRIGSFEVLICLVSPKSLNK